MNIDELQKSKKEIEEFRNKSEKKMELIDTLMIITIILFLVMIFGSCSLRCSISSNNGIGLVFSKPVIIEKTIDIKVLYHSVTDEYFSYFIYDNQIFKHIGTDLYKINEGLIISNVNSSLYYNENNKLERIEIK